MSFIHSHSSKSHSMRIVKIEDIHADGGWRVFSFLKITTDEGLVGWSEYNESNWNQGLTMVIRKLADRIIGQDPRAVARISATLGAVTRMAPGGVNQQAVAAIENACLDVKAKALGIPVYSLFGGPVRERVEVYWSHCGTFRARNAAFFEKVIGTPPLRSVDDFVELGKEAVRRGFRAVKANPVAFDAGSPRIHNPGFAIEGLDLAFNCDARTIDAMADQLAALRQGLGPQAGLLMDLNFSFKPEALRQIAAAVQPSRLTWLELDLHDPAALAQLRRVSDVPIASLEAIYGRRGYKPYLEAYAVDVAIIDVPWNGLMESVKIASMAEAYEVNIAPHNFYGHLATNMSAHLCASVPNVRIMEIEGDDVPWKDDLVTHPPVLKNGELLIPDGPGWGTEVNEEAVHAHPPKNVGSSFWLARERG
jgi:L-alanine-DL-glutamate epimerase-like enolase superfamily enzyme